MLAILLTTVSLAIQVALAEPRFRCKYLPSDRHWPSEREWDRFNTTVGGKLIKNLPIGAPCFKEYYDEAACQEVRDRWTDSRLYLPSSSSIMDSALLDRTCYPFENGTCTNGDYPEYAVDVRSPQDIISTVRFARKNNIRLVVKNTGHDYMGRSTGKAGLTIWTHNVQDTEWFDNYDDPASDYVGPAVKIYAGVVGEQLYQASHDRGYQLVGGECPTVGYAGGYIQGGGHSILSSARGMAADHVLSFEVVTTTGQFLTASPRQHADLFWALRGGGGGTYAIVWSVTSKVFPDERIALGTISFNTQDNSEDLYWAAHEAFHRRTTNFTDAGSWVFSTYTSSQFLIPAWVHPSHTKEELTTLSADLFKAWDDLGLKYNYTIDDYPTYLDTINALPSFQAPPVNDVQYGGRLIPRSLWDSEEGLQKYMDVTKKVAEMGRIIVDVAVQPWTNLPGNHDSAIFPQWRTAQRLYLTLIPFFPNDPIEKIYADRAATTNESDPLLKSLAPGIGAYLNEADPFTPNWKEDFYGENYDRLLAIKDKYDPYQMLYGAINVGGDRWAENEEGRLCPTH